MNQQNWVIEENDLFGIYSHRPSVILRGNATYLNKIQDRIIKCIRINRYDYFFNFCIDLGNYGPCIKNCLLCKCAKILCNELNGCTWGPLKHIIEIPFQKDEKEKLINIIGYLDNYIEKIGDNVISDIKRLFCLEVNANINKKEIVNIKEEDKKKIVDVQDNDIKEENFCLICMEKEKSTLFVPCGHYGTCLDCAKNLQNCPFCRCDINQVVQVYKP